MSSAPRKRTLLTSLLRGDGDDDTTTDDDCYYNDEELQQDDDDDDKKRTRGMLQLLTLILLPLFMLRVSRKLLGRSVAISCLLLFAPLVRFVTLTVDKICQNHLASHKIISPLVSIHRECESPPYETIAAAAAASKTEDEKTTSICMTTLTDEKHRSRMQQLYGWRNYKNVLETTWPNKKRYADLHGYQLFDESDQLDTSRPPAWSKPLAVKRLFQEEQCDWVIWMDADTVIMNSKKRWQDVLPAGTADLVITGDLAEPRKNNGVWAIRNSDWSRQFLDEWYNMTTFIAPVGYAYSGDQDAMNELMTRKSNKIVSPVQCTFNSFVHLMEAPTTTAQHYMLMRNLTQQEWYNSPYYYHDGDFIAHAAGVDLKLQVLQDFVKLAK